MQSKFTLDAKTITAPVKDKDGREFMVVVAKYAYRIGTGGKVERRKHGLEGAIAERPCRHCEP